MSDHISGPRALADPIADITDVYAFPSPERPGRLVLVMDTLPFASPSARFSDGLIYRFRVRPVSIADANEPGSVRRRSPGVRVRLHVRHSGEHGRRDGPGRHLPHTGR